MRALLISVIVPYLLDCSLFVVAKVLSAGVSCVVVLILGGSVPDDAVGVDPSVVYLKLAPVVDDDNVIERVP